MIQLNLLHLPRRKTCRKRDLSAKRFTREAEDSGVLVPDLAAIPLILEPKERKGRRLTSFTEGPKR